MTAAAILIPVRPCIKCGTSDRYKTGRCKACQKISVFVWRNANLEKAKADCRVYHATNYKKIKAKASAWIAANRGKVNAYSAKYRSLNLFEERAKSRDWNTANAERVKATTLAWTKANPEVIRVRSHNRRAKKSKNGGKLSKGLVAKLFKLQQGMCPCCAQPLGDDFHMDHINPLALGGPNIDENIQLLRQRCNNQKSAQHPADFMRSRGFLL
jgi:5-methylcytosine-specific restriction endonuclease McrA